MPKVKTKPEPPRPLLMVEADWMCSHLSVVRHYGHIHFNGHRYIIVDKHGHDLWECTEIANREGREKAIDPGEPADLIWDGLQRHYKRLGRDRIIELIEDGKTFDEIAATKK